METPIIKVEGLGKKYIISHERGERYTALRDVISRKTKNIIKRTTAQAPSKEEFWALKDLNFEIKAGDAVGIIGRNGAGKSTLLKILSRITEPTHGRIEINGRVASLLEVGTGFHPELTGRENIFLNGAILGMSRAEIKRKFDEIVDFSGVEKFLDTPVKRFSSGMYVRLAFAVAAHLEPEILVVDEVLAVGDAEFQKKCLGKMDEVSRKDGRTVLFVSHNMAAISNLCGSICLLNSGRIEYVGSVGEGIQQYMKNSSGMNLQEINQEEYAEIFPNDEIFELKTLEIIQDGEKRVELVTDKEIAVKYAYKVKKAVSGLRIGFDFEDGQSGITIFRTFHDDMKAGGEHEAGDFEATAVLPHNLLIAGTFNLKIAIGIHSIRWITIDKISIPLQVHNHSGVNSHYADKRPGVILPSISWSIKKF